MEDSKFNIGDWVVVKLEDTQFTGIISNKTELGYEVKDNNNYYQFVLGQYLERIDPKTAFLHDLSELLRRYDAEIHDGECYYIGFEIGANSDNSQTIHCELSKTDELCITPDNIMNFDKD